MKCISLWQPWATLVVIGAKRFETRHWPTNHRGELLIHAAKKWSKLDFRQCCQAPFASALWPTTVPHIEKFDQYLPLGSIIGMVRLDECYGIEPAKGDQLAVGPPDEDELVSPTGERLPIPDGKEFRFGDYNSGRFAWKLSAPVKFKKPIPYRGAQGFFNVPVEIVAEQLQQLGAA